MPNFLLEFGHDAAWLLFLTTVLARATSGQHLGLFRQVGMGLVSMLILTGIGLEIVAQLRQESTNIASLLSAGSVLTALFALVAAEQVYRNAREVQSRGLKYLCLGIGGIFAFDIYLYSDAMFAGKVDETLWAARGAVVAMCVPLLGVAAHRSTNWSPGIFVSRQVVFLRGAGHRRRLVYCTSNWRRVLPAIYGSQPRPRGTAYCGLGRHRCLVPCCWRLKSSAPG